MSKFKTRQGLIIDDLREYVKNWLFEKPDSKIFVGCDSQVHGKSISYATSVCMYESGKGGHIITRLEKTNRAPSKSKVTKIVTKKNVKGSGLIDVEANDYRLWQEVEKSVAIADELKDLGFPLEIHVDYNSVQNELSNKFYDAGIGFAVERGYAAKGKPNAWAASKAADKGAR